ncbi:MAG TPA: RND transporter [Janthinobacterium sp.]|nr:RND transporter [Janthinobacterium sp.]
MHASHSFRFPRRALALAACACLASGCAVGPAYQRPTTPAPAQYKEAQGWAPAAPADSLERGPWWTLFGDPVLNQLAAGVEVSNQNVAAAAAAYEQARALVRGQRAALFPSLSLSGGATRSGAGGGANNSANNANNSGGGGAATNYRAALGASWEPDIWGRLRAGVDGAAAGAQASAADLAAARLSAQGELATDYFSLRQSDAQLALLADTVAGYQRVLAITQNRFDAGIAAKSDLLQAQTQLANAQIGSLTAARSRARFEHAIAVLLGKTPAEFTLPVLAWQPRVPAIPPGLPSTLVQRRPDIAAAERRVAVANEQIGIARAAYFPSLSLTGSYGASASRVGDLLNASNSLWSLGLSAAQTLFDAGATAAKVAGARAARDAAIAHYRQTVLSAFGEVEDQLSATHVLAQQQDLHRQAARAADQVQAQLLNRYRAGQVVYSDVVAAQVTALSARQALIQAQADSQTTAVALIQALGGGWRAPE